MKILLESKSIKETHDLADLLIKTIFYNKEFFQKYFKGKAIVVSLEGSLGSGKTEFLKGIAKSLKLKNKIISPTFIVMRKYDLNDCFFKSLWHLDCYRVFDKKSLTEIGFQDLINDKNNIIFIEWGNKFKNLLPKNSLRLKFKIIADDKRLIEIYFPFKL
jgi:tRNA threonylcarbamoyladenosine biosynthesis protein TsaE